MNAVVVIVWVNHVQNTIVIVIGICAVRGAVIIVVWVNEIRNEVAVKVAIYDGREGWNTVRTGDSKAPWCVDSVEFFCQEIDTA